MICIVAGSPYGNLLSLKIVWRGSSPTNNVGAGSWLERGEADPFGIGIIICLDSPSAVSGQAPVVGSSVDET
jgi:hypothetical protein